MIHLENFLRDYLFRTPADYINSRSLAANTAETITPPAGATGVIFSCTDNFYVNTVTTAAVPGDITNGSAPELNPVGYALLSAAGVQVAAISVISPNSCVITAAFYS